MTPRSKRDHGSGGLRKRPDGLWEASLTLPSADGKQRRKTKTAKTRARANELLREMRKELDRSGDLPTSSPTLTQWSEQWLERIAQPRVKPRTFDSYRFQVRKYIQPSIGRMRLDKMTPAHVRQMHDHITEGGRSTTTALQAHRILSKMLTDAEREGRVTRNVAKLTDAPSRATVERQALSAPEAMSLLKHVADKPYGARWALALLTGMRQGECLGLTDELVDTKAGVITVAWQAQRLVWNHGCGPAVDRKRPCGRKRGGNCPQRKAPIPVGQESEQLTRNLWLVRPKSRKSWRRVKMTPALAEIIRRHMAANPGRFLFAEEDGYPVDPSDDYARWQATLAAAGLPAMPLHSARHTTATLLYALGVPEQTRMEIMGHSSATTTAGYTHLDITMQEDAMRRLDGMLQLEA